MHNSSVNTKYQNAFQSGKDVLALSDFRNLKENRNCDECEDGTAHVFCINCEQYLCKPCNLKIHNKGKRSEHLTQQRDLEKERGMSVLLLSFDEAKEVLQAKSEGRETGKKLLVFIRSLLQSNGISEETTRIYIYHRNEDETARDLIPECCESLSNLQFCVFVNIDKLIMVKEVEESFLNANLPKNEEKQSQLVKCLSFLARGYAKVYIYDRYDSSKIGSQIAASDVSETQRIYTVEHVESVFSGEGMKFAELIVKKHAKLFLKDFDHQSLSIYSQETRDFKVSSDSSTEFPEKPGFLENNSSFDEIQETGSKNNFKKPLPGSFSPNDYSGEEFILPQVVKKGSNTWGVAGGGYDRSFQRATDQKTLSQDQSDNSFEGDSHQNASYFKKKEIVPKQLDSNFGLIYHPRKEVEVDGSLELGNQLQVELCKLALQGDLMIPKETLIAHINDICKKFNRKSDLVVDKAHQAGIIRIANRKYPDGTSYNYVSLQLEVITIEALGWVCRSIKKDAMAPTEKLILSRIKECYDIKIDADSWAALLAHLNNYPSGLKKVFINESTMILPLVLSNITDASTGAETHAIYIKDEEWACEDIGTVDETAPTWKLFVKFLDEFFEEEAPQPQKKDPKGYNHNNRFSKYGNKYIGYQKYDKKMEATNDGKAIPGGRYGCAQFIKVCGPETLRKESLGKLNLYVQEAINKGFVRYQRTLLVKNTQIGLLEGGSNPNGHNAVSNDPFVEKQMRQLKKIKDALIEILYENPEGLSLAQIPQYLRRKLNFSFNLQEMGFPKLKNLLITMTDEIQIDVSGSNHSYASLKHPEKYTHLARKYGHKNYNNSNNHKYHQDEPVSLFGYTFKGNNDQNTNLQGQEPAQKVPKNGKTFIKKPISQIAEFQIKQTSDSFANKYDSFGESYDNGYDSSNDKYLQEILSLLKKIVHMNPYGLDVIDLQSRLTFELGRLIDLRYFKCESLVDFLNKYAENLVEVQVRTHHETRKVTYTVFPILSYQSLPTNPILQVPIQQLSNSSQNPNTFDLGAYFTNSIFPSVMPNNSYTTGLFPGSVPTKNSSTLNKAPESNEKYLPGPFAYFGGQEDKYNPFQLDETPKNNQYYSNFNSDFYESNSYTPQNLNYSAKTTKAPEESNYELTENFRFIENLLCDSNPTGINFLNPTGPATNFPVSETTSSTINSYSKNFHSTAVNGGFNIDETFNRIPPGLEISNKGPNNAFAKL